MAIRAVTRVDIQALPGSDFVDWTTTFPPGLPVSVGTASFTNVPTAHGQNVKLINPSIFESRHQGRGPLDWAGDFDDGDPVLYTDLEPGPITIFFDNPVQGIGANVQANVLTNQTYCVRMKLFATGGAIVSFSGSGVMTHQGAGDAPFLGAISDAADIVRAEFHVSLTGQAHDLDLAINQLELA